MVPEKSPKCLSGKTLWHSSSIVAILTMAVTGTGLLAGCDRQGQGGRAGDNRPLVVCTTTMIADLARQIGADRIRAVGIMPAGTDPHIYEPTPDDSVLFRKADLVLYNGLHLEGKMVQMFSRAGDKAVALAEDPRIEPRGAGKQKGAPDPHCWWNAKYFAIYAEQACGALLRVDPDGEAAYRERTETYVAALTALDARIREAIERIPPGQRYLITSHDAFYYYGLAYGLKVDAVLGISTDASVRALRIDELTKLVVQHQIPAIFHETSVTAALNEIVDRVVAQAAKRGHRVVVPDEALYSDSLGEEGTEAGTYLGALRMNTRIVVGGLAGEDVREILELEGGDHGGE